MSPAARKPTTARKPTRARKPTTSAPRRPAAGAPRRESRLHVALRGDRPFVLALFAVGAVLVAMLLGPLQSFTAASERVDELQARKERLTTSVAALEERRTQLNNADYIELRAREELGLVRPGEIPYVVTGLDPDVQQLRDPLPTAAVESRSWWSRIGRAFAKLFERDGA